jgi:hypothetical protein
MGTRSGPPDEAVVVGILRTARELIDQFGWQRSGYSLHGAAPRCIRKAIWDAAADATERRHSPSTVALQRISEAIYDRRGVVGGINEWEYRKRTDKAAVLAALDKAIALGPAEPLPMPERVV